MSSNTILVLIIAAVLALFSYAVITSNETAVVPTATTTVPDTSNSWKTNDSLKAKCDQKDLTPLERNLLNCTN